MRSELKIEAKKLLVGNTARLFFVSLLSFIVKSLILSGNIFMFYYVLKNNTKYYLLIIAVLAFIVGFMIISALMLGEKFIYYIRAGGSRGRFLLLFKFFRLNEIFKAAVFNMYILFFKAIWLIYFLLPFIISSALTFYLYKRDITDSFSLPFCIAICGIMLGVGMFCFICAVQRFSAAFFYYMTDDKRRIKRAVKKSITQTDGFLVVSALSQCSFSGWLLSCFSVFPLVYVVPYFKLFNVLLIVNAVESRVRSRKKYPIRFTTYKSTP